LAEGNTLTIKTFSKNLYRRIRMPAKKKAVKKAAPAKKVPAKKKSASKKK
jgi:hypothetical protein